MVAAKEPEAYAAYGEARRPDGAAHRASWSQTSKAVARDRSASPPRSQVNLLRRIAAAFSGRSVNERLAGLEKTVRKLEETDRHSLTSLDRRFTDLARAVAEQPTAKDLRELRQALRATTPQPPAQWLFDRIDQIVSGERRILIGPWTGEVGFELLYWIPFIRWVRARWTVPPERELIVSRGGVAAWYGPPTTVYTDILALFAPEEFRCAVADEKRKHRKPGAFDDRIVEAVSRHHGDVAVDVLHPGLMHRLFAPYWSDESGYAQIDQFTRHRLIDPPDDVAQPSLPFGLRRRPVLLQRVFPRQSGEPGVRTQRGYLAGPADRNRHPQSRLEC